VGAHLEKMKRFIHCLVVLIENFEFLITYGNFSLPVSDFAIFFFDDLELN